jgi:hypothetical protein
MSRSTGLKYKNRSLNEIAAVSNFKVVNFGWPCITILFAPKDEIECPHLKSAYEKREESSFQSNLRGLSTEATTLSPSFFRAELSNSMNSNQFPQIFINDQIVEDTIEDGPKGGNLRTELPVGNSNKISPEHRVSFTTINSFDFPNSNHQDAINFLPLHLSTQPLSLLNLSAPPSKMLVNNQSYNFNDLKSTLHNFFLNKNVYYPLERFSTPWENFVFVELALFMKITSPQEISHSKFNVMAILSRNSVKVKKKLKMLQMIYCKVVRKLYQSYVQKSTGHQDTSCLFKNNSEFFSYYFGEMALHKGEDLSLYNHFKCSRNSNLCYGFFMKVFGNAIFRAHFLDYLTMGFMNDFREDRFKRIENIFSRWEGLLNSGKSTVPIAIEKIQTEIRGSRFKFVLEDSLMSSFVQKFISLINSKPPSYPEEEPNLPVRVKRSHY